MFSIFICSKTPFGCWVVPTLVIGKQPHHGSLDQMWMDFDTSTTEHSQLNQGWVPNTHACDSPCLCCGSEQFLMDFIVTFLFQTQKLDCCGDWMNSKDSSKMSRINWASWRECQWTHQSQCWELQMQPKSLKWSHLHSLSLCKPGLAMSRGQLLDSHPHIDAFNYSNSANLLKLDMKLCFTSSFVPKLLLVGELCPHWWVDNSHFMAV